jgi:uncharacterized protein (TIGR02001 family)
MFKPALIAAALAAAAPAFAQDEPVEEPAETALDAAEQALDETEAPAPTGGGLDFAGSLTLLSDYRFRGVSRSDEDPAVQAALSLTHISGLYAGATATTLQGLDSFRLRDPAFRDLGDVELDLYAGYGARLGGGFGLDAGLLYYLFVGGDGATDYVEPYASLTYLIGPADFTLGARYAPSQDAIGNEDMLYLFGQADVSIPFRPWRFSALVGHQDWGRYGGYWTWSLGVEHRLALGRGADAAIGLRYVDTSLPSRSGQDAGLVASLGFSF